MRNWFVACGAYALAVVFSGPIVLLVALASGAASTPEDAEVDGEVAGGDAALVRAFRPWHVAGAASPVATAELVSRVPWLAAARPVSADELLGPGLFDTIRAATIGPPPQAIGYVRSLHGRTACQPDNARGGNPLVKVARAIPRVGAQFEVEWTTVACISPGPPPLRVAFLMVSMDPLPAPVDLTPQGATGCWLLVNPDFLMWPSSDREHLLSYLEGRINLRWTPSQSLAGRRFFAQLMVLEPGVNPANYVVSSAIEVCVGS